MVGVLYVMYLRYVLCILCMNMYLLVVVIWISQKICGEEEFPLSRGFLLFFFFFSCSNEVYLQESVGETELF